MTRCATTQKVIYKTQDRARRAINTLENAKQGAFQEAHAYRCEDRPSHWHIGRGTMDETDTSTRPGFGDEKRQATRWTRAEWDQVTLLLWARCRDMCEWCGKPLAGNLERHHRQVRAVGGDRLANLIALHTGCHVPGVHAHPAEAMARGAIVSRHAADPAVVALTLPDGREVLLDDEGAYLPVV